MFEKSMSSRSLVWWWGSREFPQKMGEFIFPHLFLSLPLVVVLPLLFWYVLGLFATINLPFSFCPVIVISK